MKLGLLVIFAVSCANPAAAQSFAATCVHSNVVFKDGSATDLQLLGHAACDILTAKETFEWTKADAENYKGMLTAYTNYKTFNTDPKNGRLPGMTMHAAESQREELCSRNPDWWVIDPKDEVIKSCKD